MLNFAIIGVGRMGKRHAFNLARGFGHKIKLTAVCDIDKKALDWCGKYAKRAKQYTDYKQMLDNEKLDGVIIATEHFSHTEIAEYAVKKGVNTLIEKPIAVTIKAAYDFVVIAKKYPDIKVGVSYNQRSNRLYAKAKKLLASGALGEIQRVNFIITDWYRSEAYYKQGGWRASYISEGGGCLINQCIHQLDILQWLIGMPEYIIADCRTVNRNISVENDVSAVLKYKNFDCLLSASTHELCGTNRLEIACDKGKIIIDKYKMRIWTHKSQVEVNATTTFGYGFAPSRKKTYSYGLIRGLRDLILGQQLRSVNAFAKEIAGSGNMLASAAEGINALMLINAIYMSAWQNREVKLPIDKNIYDKMLADKQEEEKNK